jgi:calnexin
MFALVSVALCAVPRVPDPAPFHFESFSDESYAERWQRSNQSNVTGEWELRATASPQFVAGEQMLFGRGVPAHFGLSTEFASPLDVTNRTLVLQYETRYSGVPDCAGAYIKLFGRDNFRPDALCNETRYVLMFGPDRCAGLDKVHFIFRHANARTGAVEEKHMADAPATKNDTVAHLWTLIVRPDNSFEILVDARSARRGSLLSDFAPPVSGPREVDDPEDRKPDDWVDDAEIADPAARRPDDWDEAQPQYIPDPAAAEPPDDWLPDEPRFVADPDAAIPASWDPDIHGEWEPPTIPNPRCEEAAGCGEWEPPLVENPRYRGKWYPPTIPNPAYKGPWAPRKIPNPDYCEDLHPHNFPPFVGAGFELWMVSSTVGFGNVYIGTDEDAVREWNKQHFLPKWQVQEEERKRDVQTPTPTAAPTPSPRRYVETQAFSVSFGVFVAGVSEAFTQFFAASPPLAITVAGLLIGLPLLMCSCVCREPQPKRRPLTPEEIAARKARAMARAEKKKRDELAKAALAEQPAENPPEAPH